MKWLKENLKTNFKKNSEEQKENPKERKVVFVDLKEEYPKVRVTIEELTRKLVTVWEAKKAMNEFVEKFKVLSEEVFDTAPLTLTAAKDELLAIAAEYMRDMDFLSVRYGDLKIVLEDVRLIEKSSVEAWDKLVEEIKASEDFGDKTDRVIADLKAFFIKSIDTVYIKSSEFYKKWKSITDFLVKILGLPSDFFKTKTTEETFEILTQTIRQILEAIRKKEELERAGQLTLAEITEIIEEEKITSELILGIEREVNDAKIAASDLQKAFNNTIGGLSENLRLLEELTDEMLKIRNSLVEAVNDLKESEKEIIRLEEEKELAEKEMVVPELVFVPASRKLKSGR